jgi:hypothetical protein
MEFKCACISGETYGRTDKVKKEELTAYYKKYEKVGNVDFVDEKIFDILNNPNDKMHKDVM